MDKKRVLLIGGGGHCKVVISQLKKLTEFEIVGIVDNCKPIDSLVLGIKVIGKDVDLKNFYEKGIKYALITVGSVKDNLKRAKLFEIVRKIGYKFSVVISPGALVDTSCIIKEGTVIMPGSIINVDSSIGKNCIINSGAIIEHDCKIGNHCHIAPGAHLSGDVGIGDLSFLGIGSTVIQGIKIAKNVTIGAGSVVTNDILDNRVVMGNPTRITKKKES